MVTNLQKAEAERAAIEGNITTVEQEVVDHGTTPLDEASVEALIRMANSAQEELLENNNKILVCFPTDPDPYKREHSVLLRRVLKLNRQLHGIKMSFPPSAAAGGSSAAAAAPASSCHGHHQQVKLPTLQIPQFHGDLQQWISFRDIFLATVHNKASISKIEKLSYLKSLVFGEASRQIHDIILSDSNYDIAWKALSDRYNNNRELLFSVVGKLFNQPSLPTASSLAIRQLMDTTKSCLRSLDILLVKTDECHPIIVYLVFSKLDSQTKELWLQSLTDKNIPDLEDLFSFLEQRAAALVPGQPSTPSSSSSSSSTTKSSQHRASNYQNQKAQAHHVQAADSCFSGCAQSHRLYQCDKFHKLQPQERMHHLLKNKCCFNCLGVGHNADKCMSKGSCKTCSKRHNTLIHQEKAPKPPPIHNPPVITNHLTSGNNQISKSILATAVAKVDTNYGPILTRTMLDTCSSNCFVTESFVQKWKLEVTPVSVEVVGLSSTKVGESVGVTAISMRPHFNSDVEITFQALVMPTISGKQPPSKLEHKAWTHLKNLTLADPNYHQPNYVDILIGADIFWSLLHNGPSDKIMGRKGDPLAFNSSLGWLVVGQFSNATQTTNVTTMVTNIQLNQQLERFWNDEALPESPQDEHTAEEDKCERHFKENTIRLTNGRFCVSVPWKDNKKDVGETRHLAVQRLKQIEKRLSNIKNEECKVEYVKFMQEYIDLGHMTEITTAECCKSTVQTCFIPHHFVLKLDSTTTKLRVVFDGSARSSSGTSLNQTMMIGPVVQSSLFDIILRFRLYPVAFTSDIAKMYRQVLINEEDRDMHRILWRESPDMEIKEYRLNTVIYGTASAPYLATRALVQLAEENEDKYPAAVKLIKNSTYVDDLMAGQSSVSEAKQVIQDLINIGNSAQFPFRKWSCNSEEVLQSIPEELRATKTLIPMEDEIVIKTLGIYWNPSEDAYQFKISLPPQPQPTSTKRAVRSEMSKLFDPLGWLAPVTIKAKILMQEIWKEKCDWDEKVSIRIQQQWNIYKNMLPSLEQLAIPRHFPQTKCSSVSLIGFADSSLKAFAAVIYLYGETPAGDRIMCLLTSKTRVASIHSPTLPRLELNAAVLLSELMTSVLPALDLKVKNIQAYSDSTIVLGWINSDPNRWKMYVKNRVLKIQKLLPAASWSHVKGTENPADCASRGLNGDELVNHDLWWHGNIDVIRNTSSSQPDYDFTSVLNEERKEVNCMKITVIEYNFVTKFSSLRRLIVYIAAKVRLQKYIKSSKSVIQKGVFSVEEVNYAMMEIIKCVQTNSFSLELGLLGADPPQQLPKGNNVLCLNPFLDTNRVLRVGGRLRHAKIAADQRNPILLPKNHHVTKLIINYIHLKHFHCGAQQTLAVLNQQYWIIRGRDTVRYVLKKCVTCTRQGAQLLSQQMGDLPEARVNPARAFLKTGVDFAGPFTVKNFGRSKIMWKVYLSVFVCLVTRAIHIEVVSSLSTDAFLAAFRRFISRRGRPSDVYSDCGTNFVGADRELKEMFAFQRSNKDEISDKVAKEGIHWHFNPPGAPHMGGLWEAGVKSIKYHLRRVLSSNHLTFEEFETIIIQIEGILNSRPLTAISPDPNDLQVLTPAHFLIGEPIIGLPDQDLSDVNVGRLDRWQLLQQKQQSFWKRWSSEFITRMQQRPKWLQRRRSIQLNDIVIIKDENQPPGKWKMGRVIQIHPGADDLVRVVSLKTMNGIIKDQ